MEFTTDEYLFHFTKRITFLENIIPEKKILFNPSKKCNDPREYNNFEIPLSVFNGEFNNKAFESLRHEINDIVKKKFKIACFTQNKKNKEGDINYLGYLKSRMWSQYGDVHRGVCLVLDKEKFLNEIKSFYPNNQNNIWPKLINYQSFDELYQSFEKFKESLKDHNKEDHDVIKENIDCIFFEKHIDYEHEQEYRIVIYDDKAKNDIKIPFSNSLCGLIIGDKFPEVYNDILEKFRREMNNIKLIKLEWKNGLPIIP